MGRSPYDCSRARYYSNKPRFWSGVVMASIVPGLKVTLKDGGFITIGDNIKILARRKLKSDGKKHSKDIELIILAPKDIKILRHKGKDNEISTMPKKEEAENSGNC